MRNLKIDIRAYHKGYDAGVMKDSYCEYKKGTIAHKLWIKGFQRGTVVMKFLTINQEGTNVAKRKRRIHRRNYQGEKGKVGGTDSGSLTH